MSDDEEIEELSAIVNRLQDKVEELEEGNERLKKEIEDMKVKYKHCCGTTLI